MTTSRRTKKNLSDLLREEVKKETNAPTAPASSDTPNPPTLPGMAPASDTAPQTLVVIPPPSEDSLRLTAPNLEELTNNLAAANNRTKELENQVDSLHAELATQKALVENLKQQLANSEKLQEELTEQKNLVHRIYAELQEAQGLEGELNEQKQLVQQLQTELEQLKPKDLVKQNTSGKLTKATRISHATHYITVPSDDINKNLGWFD